MFNKTILSLVLLTGMSAPALAGVSRVTVHVEGLACPFCTYNLEKRIKTLDGVPKKLHWQASVEEAIASFDWKPDVPFDADAVREQVRKAGFTPGKIETIEMVEGAAKVIATEKNVTQIRLVNDKESQIVTLRSDKRIDRQESYAMLTTYVQNHADDNEPIRVRVHGVKPKDAATTLVLHCWEPLKFRRKVVINMDKLTCERCSTAVMRSLVEEKGLIHIEADHEQNLVQVWFQSKEPDLDRLRQVIEDAGFKVARIKALPEQEAKQTEKE